MKKIITISLIASTTLLAQSLSEALKSSKVSGEIRVGYIDFQTDKGTENSALSVGGSLGFESSSYNGFQVGSTFFSSNGLGVNDSIKNEDFFDSNGDSFSILGEAYLKYSFNDFSIQGGRLLLDTPFADGDDIRAMPNMFEAAIATYGGISDLTLIGGYVTKWAGFDANSPERFIDLAPNSNGAIVLSALYLGLEDTEIGAWYYGVDEVSDILYADAIYSKELNRFNFEIGVQVANFSEKSNNFVDGTLYGVTALGEVSNFTLALAYNQSSNSDGDIPINGFGGGPYFTSMDEMTIDGLNDAKAYLGSIEYNFFDRVSLGVAYGEFENGDSTQESEEVDIILAGEIYENLSFEAIYASIEDDKNLESEDLNFDRVTLRAFYNF